MEHIKNKVRKPNTIFIVFIKSAQIKKPTGICLKNWTKCFRNSTLPYFRLLLQGINMDNDS